MSQAPSGTKPESLLVEILLTNHGTAGPYRRLREYAPCPVDRRRHPLLPILR